MESILEGVTSTLVSKGLDMALLRHQVIANNIANATTEGYRPMKIDFESQLQTIKRQFGNVGDLGTLRTQLEKLETAVQVTIDESSDKVLIDREVANLAKNTINYQALLSAKGELGEILSIAIHGGKR